MYNPRIYIRDYGAPTRRLLAFTGSYLLGAPLATLKRALILHAENPVVGEEFELLSGDMQSGSDVLGLSGSGSDLLVLTSEVAMRLSGKDVGFAYSSVGDFPSWSYSFTPTDAELSRGLYLLLSGDEQSGADQIELSGDEQTGADVLIISH